MKNALMVILDRKEFEERLAAYLMGCSWDEQARWLRSHGVQAGEDWGLGRLRQEISNVLCASTDMALGAEAQRLLIGQVAAS